jgi:hypothetical protein
MNKAACGNQSVSPFQQQSGNLWNKTFDVQSLAASYYALLTAGRAPFCPYELAKKPASNSMSIQ